RNIVAPGYFRTLGIPLVRGRDFTRADVPGSQQVVVVSEKLAARLFPGQEPLGKVIAMPVESREPEPAMIVGVAADARYRTVLDEPPLMVYAPLTQHYDSIAKLMVSVSGSASQFKPQLQRLMEQANRDLPARVNTMTEQTESALWRQRAASSLL